MRHQHRLDVMAVVQAEQQLPILNDAQTNAYLDRNVPRRAVYAKAWDEVKAA